MCNGGVWIYQTIIFYPALSLPIMQSGLPYQRSWLKYALSPASIFGNPIPSLTYYLDPPPGEGWRLPGNRRENKKECYVREWKKWKGSRMSWINLPTFINAFSISFSTNNSLPLMPTSSHQGEGRELSLNTGIGLVCWFFYYGWLFKFTWYWKTVVFKLLENAIVCSFFRNKFW